MKRTFALLLALSVVFAFSACGGEHDHNHDKPDASKKIDDAKKAVKKAVAPEGFANAKCPIMGKDIDTTAPAAKWKGGLKVGFCCPGCIDEWNDMSDVEKAKKLMQ